MKKLWLPLLAALALVALFSSCQLATTPAKTTVDGCIDSFMSALNSSDRSNLYQNLDSASGQYAEAKTAIYWDTKFKVSETYTLSGRSTSGTTVTGTFSSTITYTGYWIYTLVFVMATDSDGNAVIHSITLNGVAAANSAQTMSTSVYQ
jgi:hypothetical protein